MLRCPNCRAQNPGTNQCRRCGMELSALQRLEDDAKQLTLYALKLLAEKELENLDVAYNLLIQSCELQNDSITDMLLGFIDYTSANSTISQDKLS